jgi:hypothetical protein
MFDYLKHPTVTIIQDYLTVKEKIQSCLGILLICLSVQVLFGICLLLPIDSALNIFYNYSILDISRQVIPRAHQKFGSFAFFILVILGPFLEEIIFRLPLKLERFGMCFSLGLLTYYFSGPIYEISFYEWKFYERVAISLIVIITVYKFLPASWLDYIKIKFYSQYFYLTATLFALIHIINYAPHNASVLFFYPIFTLPQFIMGVFIGYARMKYGFFSGWFIHALINLIGFLASSSNSA